MAHSLDRLIRKLEAVCKLDEEDRAAIRLLPFTTRTVARATHLMREGDLAANCTVLLSGFAYRYKLSRSGARQIVSLHIAGEALDFQSLFLDVVDHNAQALTQADIAIIPLSALRDIIANRPRVARSIIHSLLIEASILREWVLNIGRRPSRERLAHLFCEYAVRLDTLRLNTGQGYELLMTQEQIGDALGLTSVHVNRSIRALEAEGLITRQGRSIAFPDIGRLRELADFSELYLHLRD